MVDKRKESEFSFSNETNSCTFLSKTHTRNNETCTDIYTLKYNWNVLARSCGWIQQKDDFNSEKIIFNATLNVKNVDQLTPIRGAPLERQMINPVFCWGGVGCGVWGVLCVCAYCYSCSFL